MFAFFLHLLMLKPKMSTWSLAQVLKTFVCWSQESNNENNTEPKSSDSQIFWIATKLFFFFFFVFLFFCFVLFFFFLSFFNPIFAICQIVKTTDIFWQIGHKSGMRGVIAQNVSQVPNADVTYLVSSSGFFFFFFANLKWPIHDKFKLVPFTVVSVLVWKLLISRLQCSNCRHIRPENPGRESQRRCETATNMHHLLQTSLASNLAAERQVHPTTGLYCGICALRVSKTLFLLSCRGTVFSFGYKYTLCSVTYQYCCRWLTCRN